MKITLPLEPQIEAKLIAIAQEKGVTPGDLVRTAVERIIDEENGSPSRIESARSLRGMLAKYGPAPSAEEIAQSRAEMFANFPHADF